MDEAPPTVTSFPLFPFVCPCFTFMQIPVSIFCVESIPCKISNVAQRVFLIECPHMWRTAPRSVLPKSLQCADMPCLTSTRYLAKQFSGSAASVDKKKDVIFKGNSTWLISCTFPGCKDLLRKQTSNRFQPYQRTGELSQSAPAKLAQQELCHLTSALLQLALGPTFGRAPP